VNPKFASVGISGRPIKGLRQAPARSPPRISPSTKWGPRPCSGAAANPPPAPVA